MPVALVVLAFFVGGLLGLFAMALACAAHNGEESRRVDPGRRARRSVVDRRYIGVELARRQPRRPRRRGAGWQRSVASFGSVLTGAAPDRRAAPGLPRSH